MTTPYYANFPVAPSDVVDALVALIPLPGLFESHVGTDNSLFLDVIFDADHPFTLDLLEDIAAFTGTPEQYLFVEPSAYVEQALSITMAVTAFDFTAQFAGTKFEHDPALGVGIMTEEERRAATGEDDEGDEEEDPDSEEEDDDFHCPGPYGCAGVFQGPAPEEIPGMSHLNRGPQLSQEAKDGILAGIPDLTEEQKAKAIFIDVTGMEPAAILALAQDIVIGGGL